MKLKILIVSTPKTGNIWLKHLLSEIYQLPIVSVTPGVDRAELLGYGDRWVGHQHLFPTEELHRSLAELGVRLCTTVRHPADVLLSYFHYIKALGARNELDSRDPAALMYADGDRPGENTLRYAKDSFSAVLLYSAAWLAFQTIVVRYEKLFSDPVAELRCITDQLLPAADDQITTAVAVCEMNLMRERLPNQAYHFREGASRFQPAGAKLSTELVAVLALVSPYPELNARLGYSFAETPEADKPFEYARVNPFHGKARFSNGVSIAPCMIRAYLRFIPGAKERWPDPANSEGPDSFFGHLLEPVDDAKPVVTRLALYIRSSRDDLVGIFPDFLGRNRWAYVQWFIYSGVLEYCLPQLFTAPTVASISNLVDSEADLTLRHGNMIFRSGH